MTSEFECLSKLMHAEAKSYAKLSSLACDAMTIMMETCEDEQKRLAIKDAEICILKTEACAAQKNIKRRDDDINGLMKELARWQEIAIEERAKNTTLAWDGQWTIKEPSENAMLEAAKELSIQINQEDDGDALTIAYMLCSHDANKRLKVLQDYVKRLEKEYIDATRLELYLRKYSKRGDIMLSDAYDLAEKEAQTTLEKIRHAN